MRRKRKERGGKLKECRPGDDDFRMMLMMAEKHVLEATKHREMVEEEAQKGIKEAREKVAMEMGEQ